MLIVVLLVVECKLGECLRVGMLGVRVGVQLVMVVLWWECWLWEPLPQHTLLTTCTPTVNTPTPAPPSSTPLPSPPELLSHPSTPTWSTPPQHLHPQQSYLQHSSPIITLPAHHHQHYHHEHPFRFSMSLRSDQHRVLLVAYKRHLSCNPCHTDCNWPDASVYCWWGKFASQME